MSSLPKWLEKKGVHNITKGQRQMHFLLSEKCFIFFSSLILENGNCLFSFADEIHFFFFFLLSVFHNCRDMAGPAKSEDLYVDTVLVPQIRSLLMLGGISYDTSWFPNPSGMPSNGAQSFVVTVTL